jgi:hypothetical protein
MRRAVTPAIPPSLYRNFAIVTVVVTAGLALFAEGEDGEARAAQVAHAEPVERAAPPLIARAAPRAATRSSSGGWDDVEDFDASFGAPMEMPSDRSGQNSDLGEASAPAPEGPTTLSTTERDVLLRGLRDQVTPAPRG